MKRGPRRRRRTEHGAEQSASRTEKKDGRITRSCVFPLEHPRNSWFRRPRRPFFSGARKVLPPSIFITHSNKPQTPDAPAPRLRGTTPARSIPPMYPCYLPRRTSCWLRLHPCFRNSIRESQETRIPRGESCRIPGKQVKRMQPFHHAACASTVQPPEFNFPYSAESPPTGLSRCPGRALRFGRLEAHPKRQRFVPRQSLPVLRKRGFATAGFEAR